MKINQVVDWELKYGEQYEDKMREYRTDDDFRNQLKTPIEYIMRYLLSDIPIDTNMVEQYDETKHRKLVRKFDQYGNISDVAKFELTLENNIKSDKFNIKNIIYGDEGRAIYLKYCKVLYSFEEVAHFFCSIGSKNFTHENQTHSIKLNGRKFETGVFQFVLQHFENYVKTL